MNNLPDNAIKDPSLAEAGISRIEWALQEMPVLGTLMQQFADDFGYNQSIPFELPLNPIRCSVSDDPYHLAEIASGFNKETQLSPLHAALMASVVLNGGRLMSPVLVA
jgi:cell division protein FtsI/penicillin-binding protein 2